jgi:hypothetical protein
MPSVKACIEELAVAPLWKILSAGGFFRFPWVRPYKLLLATTVKEPKHRNDQCTECKAPDSDADYDSNY